MRKVKKVVMGWLINLYEKKKEMMWRWLREREAMESPSLCLKRLLSHNDKYGNISEEQVEQFRKEIVHDERIRTRVEYYNRIYKDATFGWSWQQRTSGKQFSRVLFLYILLRLLKPEKVIETGCFSGWTSTLILLALQKNGQGHLWSIDIPAQAGSRTMNVGLPSELEPGFLVPEELRSRWTLILGDVKDHLLLLCRDIGMIDVFYHDSDHTYNHMMWEYTSIWPYLKSGGVLISDDIGANTAFWDFSLAVTANRVIYKNNLNFGAIRKA